MLKKIDKKLITKEWDVLLKIVIFLSFMCQLALRTISSPRTPTFLQAAEYIKATWKSYNFKPYAFSKIVSKKGIY